MRKVLTILLTALAVMIIAVSCDDHVHTYSDDWSSDDTYHWHAATCEHTDAVKEKAEHTFKYVVTEDNSKHYEECETCGYKKDAVDHTFGEWIVDTEATDDEDGAKHRVCSACKYEEKETIPATKHTHTYSDDWTSDDTYHWHAATCGHDVVEGKAEHTWNDGEVTTAATAETDGVRTYTCTVCGKTKTETIAKHEHEFGKWIADEETGKHYHICSVCNYKVEEDHDYEWKQTEDGTKHYQECKDCGLKTDEAAHSYSTDYKKDETNHWYECECGAKKDEKNHTLKCKATEDKKQHYEECETCGYKKDAVDHTFGEATVKEGKAVKICTACDYAETLTDATVTVKDENSFKEAIAADGVSTVKFANDITLTSDTEINKAITIDLDSKNITVDEGKKISAGNDIVVTITNPSEKWEAVAIGGHDVLLIDTDGIAYYRLLKTAVDNAEASDTIYLAKDYTITEDIEINKTVSFVLGGKLAGADKLTIKDNGVIRVCPYIEDYGTLNFEGAVAETTSVVENEYTLLYFYPTLQAAVDGNSGSTITLLDDITLSTYVNLDFWGGTHRTLTFDLNSHTISGDNSKHELFVVANADVTITGEGTLKNTGSTTDWATVGGFGNTVAAENFTVITIDKEVVVDNGRIQLFIDQNSQTKQYFPSYGFVLNFYGTINAPSNSFAFFINGNTTNTTGNVPVFNIKDATINAENNIGIYAAGYGIWNIENTTIKGKDSAIEIRAGELNIKSGTFSETADSYTVTANGGGTTTTGAVIAVSQHTTKLPIKVTIDGGTFTAAGSGKQIAIVNPQNNAAQYTKDVIVDINAECNLSKDKIVGTETLSRSEGVCDVYSVDAASLILAGYGYKFDTAKDGTDLVTISNKGSDEILYIGPTVGSAGTATNGYQLLKGTKVKFEDISIKYKDGAKKGFQKYNDLTLENVTLDASECSTMGYVVSNNFGTTTITGKTNITAYSGKVALDVYYWPNGTYDAGISVVFDSAFTGSVTGTIEFDSSNVATPKAKNGKHSLVIEAGDFSKATLSVKSFLDGSEIKIKKSVWDVSKVTLPEGYEWKEADGYLTVEKKATN